MTKAWRKFGVKSKLLTSLDSRRMVIFIPLVKKKAFRLATRFLYYYAG